MKKNLLFLITILLGFLLVSCQQVKFISVKKKDKVTMTNDQLATKIANVEQIDFSQYEANAFFQLEGINNFKEKYQWNYSYHTIKNTEQLKSNVKFDLKDKQMYLKGSTNIYVKDGNSYFDFNVNKLVGENKIGIQTEKVLIKQFFYKDNIFFIPIDLIFDTYLSKLSLENILLINNEFSGFGLYEKNDFRINFKLNNDLITNLTDELIEKLNDNIIGVRNLNINNISPKVKFNYEYVIVIDNNKITQIGFKFSAITNNMINRATVVYNFNPGKFTLPSLEGYTEKETLFQL